ncbi:hypothetical protein MBLNU230_g1669t1 [Neophaeotheca triangularis]
MTDDEILLMLLANLRNAEATFGASSPSYTSIRNTMLEHLRAMQARGAKTNLACQGDRDASELQALMGGFEKLGIREEG